MTNFSIKQIKSILSNNGMPLENIESVATDICQRHSTALDAIKEERDTYKADADKLAEAQEKLGKYEKGGKETVLKSDFDKLQLDYDTMKSEYDNYKNDIAAKETHSAKEMALRKMLKEINISDKRINAIVKVTKIDDIQLNKDGTIKDKENEAEKYKTEYAEFIETTSQKGAKIDNPPAGGKAKMTKDEISAITDRDERRQAIANNMESFEE